MKKTVAAVLSIMIALVFAVSAEASNLKKKTMVKEIELVEKYPENGQRAKKIKKGYIKEMRKSKTEK